VVEAEEVETGRFTVFASTLRRTIQTAGYLDRYVRSLHALDEIHAGVCEGMTYREIEEKMPEEYAARSLDKLVYRYPRGESYLDLIDRLDPVVLMLERWNAPVLVIAHQAVLRVLYAYLVGTPIRRIPHLDVPMHTVIKLTPAIHKFEETRVSLAEEAAGG
jgi:broad specificity phosphatase PhoE